MRWSVWLCMVLLAGCTAPVDEVASSDLDDGRPIEITMQNTGLVPYHYAVRVLDDGQEVLREQRMLLPGSSFTQDWWLEPGHAYRVEGANGPAPELDTWTLGADAKAADCRGDEFVAMSWSGGVETEEDVPTPGFAIGWKMDCVAPVTGQT